MVSMSSDNIIKIAHRVPVCVCTYLWPVWTAVKASMYSKCSTMCWKERAQGASCWDDRKGWHSPWPCSSGCAPPDHLIKAITADTELDTALRRGLGHDPFCTSPFSFVAKSVSQMRMVPSSDPDA